MPQNINPSRNLLLRSDTDKAKLDTSYDNDYLQLIRDLFKAEYPVPPDLDSGFKGYAPTPPQFRRASPIIGNSQSARTADNLFKLFPNLKDSARQITIGPTEDTIHSMIESKLDPDRFSGTTLLGVANRRTKNVSINPDVADDSATLLHELSHTQGKNELQARAIEELFSRMNKKRMGDSNYSNNLGSLSAQDIFNIAKQK